MAQRVPGIVVNIKNDTGIIAPPLFQRYPCVIGVGDPFKQIDNERVVRSLGTVDDVPCISTIHDIVSVGDLPGIAKYAESVDYELVSGQNKIHWLGSSQPSIGESFYISFTETKAATAFNNALLYFDENQVFSNHGSKTRTDGTINEISVGANIAFQNGAKGVMVVQLDPTSWTDEYVPDVTELENGFISSVDALELVTDAKLFLCPMSSGDLLTVSANQILFNHAVLASQPERKQERTVIGTMPSNTTYTDYATEAQAYAHERISFPAIPSTCQVTGFSAQYDDRYACVALAGKLCSVGIGVTIHDETLAGITFSDNFSPDVQTYLLQRGVSPMKSSSGIVRNIMANTTDTTSALTECLGVQDIKDYVKKYWRDGLWATFKNAPGTAGLPSRVALASEGILIKLVRDEVVAAWDSVSASQDPAEPRKVLVGGRIQPVFGMAYMDVTFVFVLSFSS